MATVTDYTLSTTPTLIASGVGEVYIANLSGTVDVFLGDSSVTTSTGLQVRMVFPDNFRMRLGSTDQIWAVANAVGAPPVAPTVRVLHTR
jgi:hypothetical protein